MAEARHVVGIDLGTTHCAVAHSPLPKGPGGRAAVQLFEIPQLVAPGELESRRLLPSFMYLPAPGEFADSDVKLPWGASEHIVGAMARARGAQVPNRLVASAKSWICHGGVNRRAPILPWSAPDSEPHVSPHAASVAYLSHLRAAWEAKHPDAPLTDQEVVVTVPASFDEVARELTADAAREAGLGEIRLIEEPQAALYDWLGAHADDLRESLRGVRLVLVVDVGGGTTDLTLVRVHPPVGDAPPVLERVAVGGHLMLGGDNMDAALAHHVLQAGGINRKLDPTEWAALVQSARQAKELLLADDAPEQARVSVQRRGRRLLGGTKTVTLQRDAVRALLIDGFVPHTGPTEVADRRGRAGLTTLGLPYTSDPAIPRHVCAFLRKHVGAAIAAGATVVDGLPRPDRVLLNGGVFQAPALARRLEQVISGWYGAADGAAGGAAEPVQMLQHTALDTAVALGAARFALGRRGLGTLITGGAARAYYVGVEGAEGERRAFCVAPKGMAEGSTVEVGDRTFQLVVDRPVAFPLFGYAGGRNDAAGAVTEVDDDFEPLPSIETVLRRQGDMWVDPNTGGVPVRLSASLTENGALQLYLLTVELPPRRWKLQFDLDAEPEPEPEAPTPSAGPPVAKAEPLPKKFPEARRAVERTFGSGRPAKDPKAAKGLRRTLEEALGGRGRWSLTVCRKLADALLGVAQYRTITAEHELQWLRLLSWCLRPGFGFEGDPERLDRVWALFAQGLKHPKKANWGEWWILWRRVAAGLSRDRQQTLFDAVRPWLAPPKGPPPKGQRAHGDPEMLRMLAALERLSPVAKQSAAGWLEYKFKKVNSWWPLGRLGARDPFHGDPADVVSPAVAEEWLGKLMPLDWKKADGAAFAAVMIARVTGDTRRDVSPESRQAVIRRLGEINASPHWIAMVTRATALSEKDARQVLGDALPAGLRMA